MAEKQSYLPTLGVSADTVNSIHLDKCDNSRTYGLWFRQENNKGKLKKGRLWFLFPHYSLAIECSVRQIIISWDAATQEHCSCSVYPGICGIAAYGKKHLNTVHRRIQRFHIKKKNGRSFKVGEKVYHLVPVENNNCKRKKMYRKAYILNLDQNTKRARVHYTSQIPDSEVDTNELIKV